MNQAVWTVQYKLLSAAGYNPNIHIDSLELDGDYGTDTNNAIKEWMRNTAGASALVDLFDVRGPQILSAWMGELGLTPATFKEFVGAWEAWRHAPPTVPDTTDDELPVEPPVAEDRTLPVQSKKPSMWRLYWWVPVVGALAFGLAWWAKKRKS